ncbi:TetR family transcriptional regulator [Rhabdothermincola salaria]|uniref:TetR family transcriptional regulator n=1 Tax=Rhabdothermincola salaria TaxID=2903142 RepID=UPI001E48F659|nr:TetR family transcriptional regulator [Rhabdothermincola salaria]MCD9624316.1 TetR family transcriptional regulator [Rhabdothermincola salaria]
MRTASDIRNTAGLRERNRERNRAELAAAALQLFTERGFDEVTVDDIAEAAGVSRRTFFRYFESKEDAVLPYEEERIDQLREALAQRPAHETVLATIRRVTTAIGADLSPQGPARREALARMRIVTENPSVLARSLELQSRMAEELSVLVAEHLGVEAETSLEAQVVAGAAIAAVRAAAHVWWATEGDRDFAELLGEAYDLLTTGVDLPGGPPTR